MFRGVCGEIKHLSYSTKKPKIWSMINRKLNLSNNIEENLSFSIFGKVSIGAEVAKGTNITVTATSTFDKTKTKK